MANIDRSSKIRDRFIQCVYENELTESDLVKIISEIHNDILRSKTRSQLAKEYGKCYNSHQFTKGIKYRLSGKEFITDPD